MRPMMMHDAQRSSGEEQLVAKHDEAAGASSIVNPRERLEELHNVRRTFHECGDCCEATLHGLCGHAFYRL
jgi:hypothetical protein